MLTILAKPTSNRVRQVLCLCRELKYSNESALRGGRFRAADTPVFLALNSNPLKPPLCDGDFVLTKPAMIYRYLAACFERCTPSGFRQHCSNGAR